MSLHGSDSTSLKMIFRNKNTHNTILELGKCVLRSLEKLHSLGYVHWDVKPSNILHDVLETASSETKKFTLIDFGICEKYVDALGRHIPLTKLSHFNGSIEFIATEWLQKYRKCRALCLPYLALKFLDIIRHYKFASLPEFS